MQKENDKIKLIGYKGKMEFAGPLLMVPFPPENGLEVFKWLKLYFKKIWRKND